jgi:predicted dehydrogenase
MHRRSFLAETSRTAAFAMATGFLARSAHVQAGTQPQKIKVGQIGTAHAHASGKMATLRKLSDHFEVVGIVEPDSQRRAAAERQPVYQDLPWMSEQQLLDWPGLQAVAVETAVRDLIPVASRCIAAGMHLHLDKPAGPSLPEFRQLMDEAARKELTVQMGYMFRNNPAFQCCFRAVREGWLGQVFEIHAVISKNSGEAERRNLAEFSGGTMFELGCHLIDATVAVLGQPQQVTPFIRASRCEADQLADNMLAVLEYPQATCTVRSSLIEIEGGRRRQLVVCGTEGTIDIRPLEPPVMQLALETPRESFQRGYQPVTLPAMPGRYDDQLIELARIIRGEFEHPYPPAHDLAVHETILRASGMPCTAPKR